MAMTKEKLIKAVEVIREYRDKFKDSFDEVKKLFDTLVFRNDTEISNKIAEFESWKELDEAFNEIKKDKKVMKALDVIGGFIKEAIKIAAVHKLGKKEE